MPHLRMGLASGKGNRDFLSSRVQEVVFLRPPACFEENNEEFMTGIFKQGTVVPDTFRFNLDRPLCVFDLETTGLVIGKDRIVEIALVKVMPDGSEAQMHRYVDPQMEIPKEVSAIHGLTARKLAELGALPFSEIAGEIAAFIGDSDLAGFNSNKFDIPLLVEEFRRVGVAFSMENRYAVDVQNIFHKMEQRTLPAACRFYLGRDLVGAHSAMADTQATLEVLKAQVVRYEGVEYEDKSGKTCIPVRNDVKALAEFSSVRRSVDLAGRIGYDEQGREVFNFGQHKGKRLREFFRTDAGHGYLRWILSADFPEDTKQAMKRIFDEEMKLKKLQEKFSPENG